MKRTNTILAAAFLVLMAAMAVYTCLDLSTVRWTIVDAWHARGEQEGDTLLTKVEFAADQTEGALNAALDREHYFIQLYGGVQRLTGQRFVEDSYSYSVIRLDNGSLTFGSVDQQQVDTAPNAAATLELAEILAQRGIPFTAVMAPIKTPRGRLTTPAALQDFHNQEGDQFLSLLEAGGLHTIDLRDGLGSDLEPYFFRTDHHWNADGAFVGNQIMTRLLAEEYGFTPFAPGLDEASFTQKVYEDLFLGSQGKRVGTLYAGVDDFVAYYPDFDTHLTYDYSHSAQPREGTLEQTMYFEGYLAKDYFNGNPYLYFSGGDWPCATITNHLNPAGPKVVMIRDSFACALTPFFALQCSELTTIDLRAFGDGDLLSAITNAEPDLVLLFYSPSTSASANMFEFFK